MIGSDLKRRRRTAERPGRAHLPTPVIDLTPPGLPPAVTVLAKLEGLNPGLSVKDRVARYMLDRALRNVEDPGSVTVVEASSGNTAVGVALAAREMGTNAWLFVPEGSGKARLERIADLGARLTLTPAVEGTTGAQKRAAEAASANDRTYYLGQHERTDNLMAHLVSTGPEVWSQTGGRVDMFVAGVGTGGTLLGVGRYLGERAESLSLVGVVPSEGERIPGLRPYDPRNVRLHGLIDPGVLLQVTQREAVMWKSWIESSISVPVGPSSGAAMAGVARAAAGMERGVVLTILPDHGFNYVGG